MRRPRSEEQRVRTNAKAEPTLPELLANLSEPGPGASSLRAAAALLGSRATEEAIAGLLPLLVRHKTLPLALGHLERAGGDLGALTIPASLYESTYPLNRLLPPWPGDGDDRISLFELRRRLHAHGAVQDGDVRRLGEEAGEDRFMLVTGQAWAVAYPEYPRWCADADLFAPDLETGLHLLDCLCSRMGFVMHGFKVGRLDVDGFAI